jgi:hypothetical protein
MSNLTDELEAWVLRINALCAEKDAEIKRLKAALERATNADKDDDHPANCKCETCRFWGA